jgi:hypothetical protein
MVKNMIKQLKKTQLRKEIIKFYEKKNQKKFSLFKVFCEKNSN